MASTCVKLPCLGHRNKIVLRLWKGNRVGDGFKLRRFYTVVMDNSLFMIRKYSYVCTRI